MGNNSSFCVSASHKCPPLGFFTSAAGDVAFAPSGRWLFFFSCGSRLNSALVQCDLASCPPTDVSHLATFVFNSWTSSSRCWTYCHNWRTVSSCLGSVGLDAKFCFLCVFSAWFFTLLTDSLFTFCYFVLIASQHLWYMIFIDHFLILVLHLLTSLTAILYILIIFRISVSLKSCLLPCLSWYFLWVFFTLQSATKFYQNCVPFRMLLLCVEELKTSLCIYTWRHVYKHV